MEDKNQDRFLDDLLDAGLARYTNVTPRPGLEGRILANARAARERRPWFVWAGWLASGAVAAAILLSVLAVTRLRTPPPPPVPVVSRPGVQEHLLPGLRPVTRLARARHRMRPLYPHQASGAAAVAAAEEVRLAQFPSPQPLTEQEKLLVQYVRQAPPEALAASPTESTVIPDLEIKPLDIAPLDAEETEPKTK